MRKKTFSKRQQHAVTVALVITLLLTASLRTKARQPGRLAPSGSVVFSIEDLGTFGGSSFATDLNDAGQVVGYSFVQPANLAHAFRFTDGVGLVDLTVLAHENNAYGAEINNSGQVSGSVDRSGGAGGYHAFRYTDGVGLEDLGSLPGYGFSYGESINEHGQVAGAAYGAVLRAFRFTDGVGMLDLGTLTAGRVSHGLKINDSGDVVGYSEMPDTQNDTWNPGHAFLYTDGSGMQDLNSLISPSLGWDLRKASAINNQGQVVGFGAHAGIGVHAFRYDLGCVLDLGTFPGGGISYALDINNRGDVVGAAYLDASGAGNFRAMLYTNQSGMQNLNDLIDPSPGWILREATGINERGQIVGWGLLNGHERAFRLTAVGCCPAGSCTVVVPGTSNPWLAGVPAGTPTPDGDSAPAQSPVLVSCMALTPGDRLAFNAFGNVSNCPSGCPTSGPDGGEIISHLYGAEFGKSDITAPLNSLLGVFLGPGLPGSPPPPLSFSTPALQNYGNLSPLLAQVFFIGDGMGSSGGTSFCQGVIVPSGATRLFLGTMDGFDWKNNINNFAVTICKQNGFCLQDDSNGNLLRFDAATGHYLFARCSDGVTVTGRGLVTVSGCTISLHDFVLQADPPPFGAPTPYDVTASVNTCSMRGTASVTLTARRLVRVFPINDTSTTNNTCGCPAAGLPDLVPEPIPSIPGPVGFCRLDAAGRLVVRVRNLGAAASLPTFTKVEFLPGGVFYLRTPSIPPSGVIDLSPLDFPSGCHNPDCDFRITVDAVEFVIETNESNNTADGRCVG